MEAKNAGTGTQRNVEKGIDSYTKTAHQAVDRAADAASTVASRVNERVEAIGAKGEEFLEMKDAWIGGAREYVKEHPLQALGIAVAAGYLLSMMMRGK